MSDEAHLSALRETARALNVAISDAEKAGITIRAELIDVPMFGERDGSTRLVVRASRYLGSTS